MKCNWCDAEKPEGKVYEAVTYSASTSTANSTFSRTMTTTYSGFTPVSVFICDDCIMSENQKDFKNYRRDNLLGLVLSAILAPLLSIIPIWAFLETKDFRFLILLSPIPLFLWFMVFYQYCKKIGKNWAVKLLKSKAPTVEETFGKMASYSTACVAQHRGHDYYDSLENLSRNELRRWNIDQYKFLPWSKKLSYK